MAAGAGDVEWEDESDPARSKCVGSEANGRIGDKALLDDLDAPVIDDTIRPRAASGMLSAARWEDTHAIARSAAVPAKTGNDDVQPVHGDWESAASASALPWPKRWFASAGCAATYTPTSVARLAIRSSAVSARLPSMAVESVCHNAHVLAAASTIATEMEAIAALRLREA